MTSHTAHRGSRDAACYGASVRAFLSGLWLVALCGCGPQALVDAGADADLDAGEGDAAICTGVPGDLPGEREIAAGALLPDLPLLTEPASTLAAFHTPCEARVLVIRSMAAWSGPARWHAAHTSALAGAPRVSVIDLLTEDEDALPATAEARARWATRYDAPPDALAIDPEDRFAVLAFGGVRLPVVALVDARDLRVMRVLFQPHAGDVEYEVEVALARMDGRPRPEAPSPTLHDGRFTDDAWDLITAMRWSPPPADPSNAVAESLDAQGVGATFFEDPGLSPAGVGCASCHGPTTGFADGLPVGRGVGDVLRNTPTLIGAAHSRWPFWDGRVDSLWAQALGPIENPLEMGSSRLFVAHRIFDVHRRSYEAVFGAMPDISDFSRFPASGRPGDAAWEAMTSGDQDTITRIAVNVSKAIAAYERTIVPVETAFDRYLAGDLEALTPIERDGLLRFVENACIQCHYGPTLSDDAFHAIAMPGSVPGDQGRIDALPPLVTSPFRRTGTFSDDAAALDPLASVSAFPETMRGAFRTPPLRNLNATAPYGHGGTFVTLREVVTHYATVRGAPPVDPRITGSLDRHVPGFDAIETQIGPLTAFLEAL